MRRVVASLAAVVIALAGSGGGDDGAEPGASEEATLVLDFTPNAVHAGIYAALAILDIHDLALARERGLDLVGVGAIVHRPLAAVIAADGEVVREPADLA